MRRAMLVELFHMVAGLLLTAAIFAGAAWSYPQGETTILQVGCVTLAAVFGMSLFELRRAWKTRGGESRISHG